MSKITLAIMLSTMAGNVGAMEFEESDKNYLNLGISKQAFDAKVEELAKTELSKISGAGSNARKEQVRTRYAMQLQNEIQQERMQQMIEQPRQENEPLQQRQKIEQPRQENEPLQQQRVIRQLQQQVIDHQRQENEPLRQQVGQLEQKIEPLQEDIMQLRQELEQLRQELKQLRQRN